MKKIYFKIFILVLLVTIVSACASTSNTAGSSTTERTANKTAETSTAEDLSKYRPKFNSPATSNAGTSVTTNNTAANAAITPTNHVNAKVTALLDTVAIMNKSVRFAQGYRILAYSGMERKAALDLRNAIVTRLPDEQVYPQYKQPTWRIKVGDYFSRIEAQQVLLRINDLAPNAMIVVDQINVK